MASEVEVIRHDAGPIAVAQPVFSGAAVHVFHHPGAITTGISDEFGVMIDGLAYYAWAHITTPGSGTVVDILHNGGTIGTISVDPGAKNGNVTLAQSVYGSSFDYFAVGAIETGGASGLWVGVYVH